MQRLLHEGMDAGLCGFSIQRLGEDSTQADFDGSPMVTDTMCDEDILALAEVLRERDEGFIQITQSTGDARKDLAFQEKLAEVAQRPILHNAIIAATKDPHIHQRSMRWIEKCWNQGLPIYGQTATLRTGNVLTLEHWNLYDASHAWRTVTTGTKEEKLAKMRDPDLKAAVVREAEAADKKLQAIQAGVSGMPHRLIVQSVNGQPELEKYVGKSLRQIAEEEGKHHIEVMIDLSVAGDLNVEFLQPERNFNAEFNAEMINDSPYTIPGVSDGGAHTKFFNGGSWTTDFLRWLVRDEGKITLEEAHYRMSALAAHAAGFKDRGRAARGRGGRRRGLRHGRARHRAALGRRGRLRLPRRRVAPGAAGQGLQGHHRQRRGDLRGRRLHGRHARPAAPPRPRLRFLTTRTSRLARYGPLP